MKRLKGDAESRPISAGVSSLDLLGSMKSEGIVGLLDCKERRDRARQWVFLCTKIKPDIVYNNVRVTAISFSIWGPGDVIDLACLCDSDDSIRDEFFHLNSVQTLGGGRESNLFNSNAADREELTPLYEWGFSVVVKPATLFDNCIRQEGDWLATRIGVGELELFVMWVRDSLKKIGEDIGGVRKRKFLIHPS